MARESKPFRDRNPVTIGAISLSVIAALVFLAFNAEALPEFVLEDGMRIEWAAMLRLLAMIAPDYRD